MRYLGVAKLDRIDQDSLITGKGPDLAIPKVSHAIPLRPLLRYHHFDYLLTLTTIIKEKVFFAIPVEIFCRGCYNNKFLCVAIAD